jgi:transcriptional regulator with XRE-family HTH domain
VNSMNDSFGKLLRQIRVNRNITLREFSRSVAYDPSNVSKIERGITPPPATIILKGWVEPLGLEPGTREYQDFFDCASLARNRIPEDAPDVFRNRLLPAMLRTARSKNLTEEDFEKLIRLLNK